MASKKIIGICWIVAPFALMVFSLVSFAILSVLFSIGAGNSIQIFSTVINSILELLSLVSGGIRTFATTIHLILGLLVLVSIVGIPVGLVVGIIYLTARPEQPQDTQTGTKV